MHRVIVGVTSLWSLGVPIFEARPVFVMIISQALQSITLPITMRLYSLTDQPPRLDGGASE
jgi:hypothetical protein